MEASGHRFGFFGVTFAMKFRVKVSSKGDTYLWGSAGLDKDSSTGVPLFLSLRNDELGEEIQLRYRQLSGTDGTYGNLKPGESFSVSLAQVLGVFAVPLQGDTHVECQICCGCTSE